MNPHAAATPDDAEISIEPCVEPFKSSKTSLPLTARSALIWTWKSLAVGALSSTREIKSAIACVEVAETAGFGHWIVLPTAKDSVNDKIKNHRSFYLNLTTFFLLKNWLIKSTFFGSFV